jgi:hypothetical protein
VPPTVVTVGAPQRFVDPLVAQIQSPGELGVLLD